ncbi:MAG: hypothetical protein IPJ34_13750 [Myxococcales bacterium]|nr:hypothetical protein [Myxococcales bacterium]
MNRQQLEHVIRAAGDIANDDDIVVIGSQSILASHPDAPQVLLASTEADVYPRNHPERADLIDGCIGEGSPFHETYGYYAQGVGEATAILPSGWADRLVALRNDNTRGVTGWCLDPHDLVVAKTIAGRDKDLVFLRAAVDAGLVQVELLLARLATVTVEEPRREAARARIEATRRG